jgi:uncharacterized membrane protein
MGTGEHEGLAGPVCALLFGVFFLPPLFVERRDARYSCSQQQQQQQQQQEQRSLDRI